MLERRTWSGVHVLVTQSCPTLCDPMDCSLSGSSVHGILQAKILEWVAISFSRKSSQPRDRTWVSCIAGRFFVWAAVYSVVYSKQICFGTQVLLKQPTQALIFKSVFLTLKHLNPLWSIMSIYILACTQLWDSLVTFLQAVRERLLLSWLPCLQHR